MNTNILGCAGCGAAVAGPGTPLRAHQDQLGLTIRSREGMLAVAAGQKTTDPFNGLTLA